MGIGPYAVLSRMSDVDYEAETPGRHKEIFYHVNLLKPFLSLFLQGNNDGSQEEEIETNFHGGETLSYN